MIVAVGYNIKGARLLIVRGKEKGLEECEGCEASRGGLKAKRVDSKALTGGCGWSFRGKQVKTIRGGNWVLGVVHHGQGQGTRTRATRGAVILDQSPCGTPSALMSGRRILAPNGAMQWQGRWAGSREREVR